MCGRVGDQVFPGTLTARACHRGPIVNAVIAETVECITRRGSASSGRVRLRRNRWCADARAVNASTHPPDGGSKT